MHIQKRVGFNAQKRSALFVRPGFARNHERKIILGTSDAWSNQFVPSSKQPRVFYCKLTDLKSGTLIKFKFSKKET